MTRDSLAPEQQVILSLLDQGDRYRYEFVDAVEISYSRLADLLSSLIQQELVTYDFEPGGAQRFKLGAAAAKTLPPSGFAAWLRS